MEKFSIVLFCIALLAICVIRISITNTILYSVWIRKFTDEKKLILRASLFSGIAILVTYLIFSIIFAVNLFPSIYVENIFEKLVNSFFGGLITNVSIGSYILFAVIELVTALIIIYCFHRFIVYRNLKMPKNQKRIFLLISSILNAPYFIIVPILDISFISDILNNIVLYWLY